MRCKNGTRKSKKTGNCETKRSSTSARRCKKGTRRNKKTTFCETYTKSSKSSTKATKTHLSEKEVDEIISENYHYDKKTTAEIKILVKMELSNLTFDKQYKSCFGNRHKNLYQQAIGKIAMFQKIWRSNNIKKNKTLKNKTLKNKIDIKTTIISILQ